MDTVVLTLASGSRVLFRTKDIISAVEYTKRDADDEGNTVIAVLSPTKSDFKLSNIVVRESIEEVAAYI